MSKAVPRRQVNVGFHAHELNQVRACAERVGMSVSTYVRRITLANKSLVSDDRQRMVIRNQPVRGYYGVFEWQEDANSYTCIGKVIDHRRDIADVLSATEESRA